MDTTQTQCKHCTKEISVNAKRCPHCQGDLRNWFLRHKIITTILILFILGTVLSALGDEPTPTTTPDNSPQIQEETEEVITVSAYELSREYDANKVAADTKYEDKMVAVTGTIDDIGKDIIDDPYVTLESSINTFMKVQCMFEASAEPQLAELSKGTSITLVGRVSGELIGNVVLRDCQIQ